MKFTYTWLKDFVPLSLKPAALAHKLTMAGLEVKGIEEHDGDSVFEVEITSNRPDWLSVAGIAREVAALTGKPFAYPKTLSAGTVPAVRGAGCVRVTVADKRDCPLYTARVISGVSVGPSPEWLKRRLELIGCRSINNVVDVTNYILYTCGEPLHAFDHALLGADTVSVRRGREGEKLMTLDGHERALTPGMLVIAAGSRPVALAGIMGGKDTEVTETTRTIVLEAAVFDPVVIRRGVKACGVSSESSYRFERGIDPALALHASSIAASMIMALAGGRGGAAAGTDYRAPQPRRVVVGVPAMRQMLGIPLTAAKVRKILAPLGFAVSRRGKDALNITVPSWRRDVSAPADIIEETARIHGYEKIPALLAPVCPAIPAVSLRDKLCALKRAVAGLGFNEAITYSLVDEAAADYGSGLFNIEPVRLLNPLTSDQALLRTSLIPSLVRCVGHNLNQQQECAAVFEVAKVFALADREHYALGLAVSGSRASVQESGAFRESLGFYHIKGAVEQVFTSLGLTDGRFRTGRRPDTVDIFVGDEELGVIVRVSSDAASRFGAKGRDVVAAQLNAEKLLARAADIRRKFEPLPRYPAIIRDISFVKQPAPAFEDIRAALMREGRPVLKDVRVIDYYGGKGVPDGSRSITVSLCYRADERTLSDAEIEPVHARLLCVVRDTFKLPLR